MHGPGRTLKELGLAVAPRAEPLAYPGAWPAESGLLDGDRLLPPARDRRAYEGRVPVLAVGSNACPGQLRDKLDEFGIRSPVPMVRARVTGVDIGVSAHVSLMGYVSAAPFDSPGTVRELFVLWLDAEQLSVVDASEGVMRPSGAYDRVWLPGCDVRIEPEAGPSLHGAHAYVNRHGVLHDGTGAPRHHPGERRLLAELLAGSPRLRELFGRTPEEFSARARFDRGLCDKGTRVFAEEGMAVASGLERYVGAARTAGDVRAGRPGAGPPPAPSSARPPGR
ncbi:hypothetical protein [Streptomyces poonensis]|uniref:Uncharacterized protein n=1 Tax=Streptomyces poonensis TaxID=68255 RepID=A0A918Q6N5_9ACTN|nr:hypothetical protein [Streptomyces poonensis]GGZ35695.1 hypothetical protein GCM10010365_65690 [Streptomyces poonensis]GLJ89630.1 hypothetical protein GCM10017589_22300 [Streptomyces poonensis]